MIRIGLLTTLLGVLLVANIAAASPPTPDYTRAVYINQPILGNNGVDDLAEKLRGFAAADNKKPVSILIDSPGGSVHIGLLFMDSMAAVRAQGVRIDCYVTKMAASMAFQILTACDRRYGLVNTVYLWHPPRIMTGMGETITPNQARVLADELEEVDSRIHEQLVNSLPLSEKELDKHYIRETLHWGISLEKLAPGWIEIYTYIPGLLDVPAEVPRLQAPSMFGFMRGLRGRVIHILPTQYWGTQGARFLPKASSDQETK